MDKKIATPKSTIRDMTIGNPALLIIGFALPMLIGTLFQQFYSMVDTIMVGQYLGVGSLAAVGSTSAINFMVNGFVIGICSGFSIPVAQKFGAKDYSGMRKFAVNAGWLGIFFSICLTLVICALTRHILVWMDTPEEILEETYLYIIIVFAGIPVKILYNLTASVIRALGDSKTPLYFLVIAALTNVVLDYISLVYLSFGVDGPAYATVISECLSGVLCFIYMCKRFTILKLEKEEGKLNLSLCKTLLAMGLPMGLQYSITAIGSVILQTAVNGLGAIVMAAITAGQKISVAFIAVTDALGMAMATYCSQNVGAGKLDRVREGVKSATIMGLIYAGIAVILVIAFGREFPRMFVDTDQSDVIMMARNFLLYNALFYWALIFVNVWRNAIQGLGFSTFSIFSGICEMFARALIGFVCVPIFGYIAACFAAPLAWMAATVFLIPGFHHCMRKLEGILGKSGQ